MFNNMLCSESDFVPFVGLSSNQQLNQINYLINSANPVVKDILSTSEGHNGRVNPFKINYKTIKRRKLKLKKLNLGRWEKKLDARLANLRGLANRVKTDYNNVNYQEPDSNNFQISNNDQSGSNNFSSNFDNTLTNTYQNSYSYNNQNTDNNYMYYHNPLLYNATYPQAYYNYPLPINNNQYIQQNETSTSNNILINTDNFQDILNYSVQNEDTFTQNNKTNQIPNKTDKIIEEKLETDTQTINFENKSVNIEDWGYQHEFKTFKRNTYKSKTIVMLEQWGDDLDKEREQLNKLQKTQINEKSINNIQKYKDVDNWISNNCCTTTPLNKPSEAVSWYSKYNPSDIVAIDVETVCLTNKLVKETKLGKCQPGTIGLVFGDGKEKHFKVKWRRGDFLVNSNVFPINGFEFDSLEDGVELKKVLNEIKTLIQGKLIVLFGGDNDKASLQINHYQYDIFDLQAYYKKRMDDGKIAPHNLKSVVNHYFPNTSFQNGMHSALEDARITLQLFNIYRNETEGRIVYRDFVRTDTIEHIPRENILIKPKKAFVDNQGKITYTNYRKF